MCRTGDCDLCRDIARIEHANDTSQLDLKITRRVVPKNTNTRSKWIKFRDDTKVGDGADDADPVDVSYLTLFRK